jgi:hypothetical protein
MSSLATRSISLVYDIIDRVEFLSNEYIDNEDVYSSLRNMVYTLYSVAENLYNIVYTVNSSGLLCCVSVLRSIIRSVTEIRDSLRDVLNALKTLQLGEHRIEIAIDLYELTVSVLSLVKICRSWIYLCT